MFHHSVLLVLLVTQLPLTQQIAVESPAEWPVSVTYSVAPSTMSGMLDLSLFVSNNAGSPIVALVFDKPDEFNGKMVSTGETGMFFVEGVSGNEERFPINSRTTRTVPVLLSSASSGVRQTLRLKSVLFADGTSLGQREPYVYRYVNEVLKRRIRVSEEALANEQAPEKVQLLEGLIATYRERATAFSAVSEGWIENRVRVPQQAP